MSLITITELSLKVYASESAVNTWREMQENGQKSRNESYLKPTVHTNIAAKYEHTNVLSKNIHTNTPHSNSYAQSAGSDRHTDTSHSDSVRPGAHTDSHSNSSHSDSHSNSSHRNSSSGYSRTTAGYSQNVHSNSGYSQRSYSNHRNNIHGNLTRAGYTDKTDYSQHSNTRRSGYSHSNSSGSHSDTARHTNSAGYDRHTDSGYGRNTHSDSIGADRHTDSGYGRNTYSNVPARNRHTDLAARNSYAQEVGTNYYTYTPAYNQKFNHNNYVPAPPAIGTDDGTQLQGKTIENGTLYLRFASYDKDKDVTYSGDPEFKANSNKVLYDFVITQITDKDDRSVNNVVKTVTGATSPDFNLDVSGYPDGIYKIEVRAKNPPNSKNGYTETYESIYKEATFTIQNETLCDLSIINAAEFAKYILGNDTYAQNTGIIKKYTEHDIYYGDATHQQPSTPQKGIFAEIKLTDDAEGQNHYHKVYAGIELNGVTVVPATYRVHFIEGDTAKGNKTGYVYIPIEGTMLQGASRKDMNIILNTQEYYDVAMTDRVIKPEILKGKSTSGTVILFSVDVTEPIATIVTPALSTKTKSIDITFNCEDVGGLGIKALQWKFVPHGDPAPTRDSSGWNTASGLSKTVTLNTLGDWDLYVRAEDLAGNECIVSNPPDKPYRIGMAMVDFDPDPHVVRPGDDVVIEGLEIKTDLDVTDVEYDFDADPGEKPGTRTSEEDTAIPDVKKYEYEVEYHIPDDLDPGTYDILVEITYGDGSTETVSATIRVVDSFGEILGEDIKHTPEWEQHRIDFNNDHSSDPSKQRPENYFWSGEAFVISADIKFTDIDTVNESCLLEKVTIVGETDPMSGRPFVYDFTDYINSGVWQTAGVEQPDHSIILHQEGVFIDPAWIYMWGAGKELTFKFEFLDGTIHYKTVIINNDEQYFKYHRAH